MAAAVRAGRKAKKKPMAHAPKNAHKKSSSDRAMLKNPNRSRT
jgi:hypothetical protein